MLVDINDAIRVMKDLKKREKKFCGPDSLEHTILHHDRLMALDVAIKALDVIEELESIHYIANTSINYGRGFDDGVTFVLDKIDKVYDVFDKPVGDKK